jgi:membrane AbrB-like protein
VPGSRGVADRIEGSRTLTWTAAILTGAALSALLALLGVESASLLGGCLGSAAVALWLGRGGDIGLRVPRFVRGVAQAAIGAHLGFIVDTSALASIGSGWFIVLIVLGGTIATCMLVAWSIARRTTVSLATAQMGLMPGGASVSVAVSDDVGTDPRLVAVMQYTRVYFILLTLPFIATALQHGRSASASSPDLDGSGGDVWLGLVVLIGCVTAAMALMRVVPFPSGYLLIPLIMSTVVNAVDTGSSIALPDWPLVIALGALGLFVGVQVTVESLRQARDALPAILVATVVVLAVCAALGMAMAALLDKSMLEGYLATTPGGLNVILGVVAGGGADATFVTAAQILRVLVMLLAVPLLGAWHGRSISADVDGVG